jgi:hypothetical protein
LKVIVFGLTVFVGRMVETVGAVKIADWVNVRGIVVDVGDGEAE